MANTGKLKTENLMMRMSERDKAELKEIAAKRGMNMAEMVMFLIRREYDWEKHDEDRKTYEPTYED